MLSDFVKDITLYKKGDLLNYSDNEVHFNSFIIQKICSMDSENICDVLNQTTNKFLTCLNKKQLYVMLLKIIPQKPIKYNKISSSNKNKLMFNESDKKAIKFLSSKYNIGKRDVEEYIKNFDLNIEKFSKELN